MLVFIFNEEKFSLLKLKNKKIDLIFVLDEKLFNKLLSYKVVLLNEIGKIVKENFFPNEIYKISESKIIDVKKAVYTYFYKEFINIYRKKIGPIKFMQREINRFVSFLYKKKNLTDLYLFADEMIFYQIIKYLEIKYSRDMVKRNEKYFRVIFNYITSFYRGYVYSFDVKRGGELFADINRFLLFYEIVVNIRPTREDFFRGNLKKEYLKVLARVFIEDIHKKSKKRLIFNMLNEWQELGYIK